MSDDESQTRENTARGKARQILGAEPETFESPLAVLASPAWRGIEGDIWRAKAKEGSVILKHYHADVDFYVDPAAAINAADRAGKIGIGPAVVQSWPDEGIVAFEDLADPWRAGGLHDAVNATVRSNVIACKKSFQSGAALENDACIFDEIESLYEIARSGNVVTHNDAVVFLEFFRDAGGKLNASGRDRVPCHRDGNTANIMVGPEDAVRLVDFDLAANCDPFEDIGCYLIEFFESDAEARGGFEEWYGQFDEGLFQRSMLYGLADDMRWGLIAAIMAVRSPRSSLEFSKYSAWRFMRLQAQAKRSDANDRIRISA